jgi:hypothetical protein
LPRRENPNLERPAVEKTYTVVGVYLACMALALFIIMFGVTSLNIELILPVVLYGCETWSLTLREEHRLRVFENGVLRRIFGSKMDEDRGMEKIT